MKKLIVAIDTPDKNKALTLVDTLSPWVDIFKIGPVLFIPHGPEITRMIRARGKNVFLDLKLHDIPATVSRAVEAARDLGVYSMTVHSAGGEDMLKAAASVRSRPKLWAVTVLTSQNTGPEEVVRRAELAMSCGIDGVIASAHEVTAVKKACGKGFTVVTPGIRSSVDSVGDQKRTATAAEAVGLGADFIVVGRPVISAGSPAEAARNLIDEIDPEKGRGRQ